MEYFIIPAMPTPNGGLHLGHIGGPYLKADILARYLRMQGHTAVVASGIDCYETFVELQAHAEQTTYSQLCEKYYQQISNDLVNLNIKMDYFINPLNKQYHSYFSTKHITLLDELLKNNRTVIKTEKIFHDENGRYLTGCWLKGHCCFCSTEMTSYFCDGCSAYLSSEEICHTNKNYYTLIDNIFLKPCKTVDLDNKGVPPTIQKKYTAFLSAQNASARLTTKSAWGIPYQEDKILFSYGFIYAYYAFLGEIAREYFVTKKNPFTIDSQITIVASFGIDNAVPALASILGMSAGLPQYKPVDYYLVNYFYHLDGAKFSTSRRHAIWVEDLINKAKANSDIVRFYLASIDITNNHNAFSSDEFLHFYHETIHWITLLVLKPMHSATQNNALLMQFQMIKQEYMQAMELNSSLPHRAVQAILHWVEIGKKHFNDLYWSTGLAMLIYPFMPNLGQALWTSLGYLDQPILKDILTLPRKNSNQKISLNLKSITKNELDACIQGALC